MLVDGGTLNRTRHLNISIGCEGKSYFWKSIRVPSLNTLEILNQLACVIDELATNEVYTFCIVADNAKAFQKAAGVFLFSSP